MSSRADAQRVGYNRRMKKVQLFLAASVIFIPILLMTVFSTSPLPINILAANRVKHASVAEDNADVTPALQLLLAFEPWRGDLWQKLARIHLDAGDYSKAIEAFTLSDKFSGLDGDGLVWLADALISNGNTQEAKELLRKISDEQSEFFQLWQVISLQRRIGDVYGAESTLLTAHMLFPQNAEVNFLLGLMLSTTQPDDAVRFLAAQQTLSREETLLAEALVATINGSNEERSTSDRFRQIGQVLSTFYEWDVAAQAFHSAVSTDPGNALNWILLAEAQQQLGVEAYEALSKAQALEPEDEIVNGLSGLYYRRHAKYELALRYLQKAASKNPQQNVWLIELGNTYQEMGNLELAYEHFIKAVNLNPEDWTSWKALAAFCFTFNYEVQETGLVAARKALSLNPSSPVLIDLLGTGLMLTGDYDSAERFFMEADRLDPGQSAILVHIGQLKILQKDYQSARSYLQQAIDHAPSNRLRELASQLLREISGK